VEWRDLFVALALLLVIEGIFPFLNPGALRNLLQMMTQMDDKTLRFSGLTSMVAGVIILYLVN